MSTIEIYRAIFLNSIPLDFAREMEYHDLMLLCFEMSRSEEEEQPPQKITATELLNHTVRKEVENK